MRPFELGEGSALALLVELQEFLVLVSRRFPLLLPIQSLGSGELKPLGLPELRPPLDGHLIERSGGSEGGPQCQGEPGDENPGQGFCDWSHWLYSRLA